MLLGKLALSVLFIIVGESWLLARMTQGAILPPFFLILPVLLGGIGFCYTTLRELTASRRSGTIAALMPVAILIVWGAFWGLAVPDGNPISDTLEPMNSMNQYWLEKGMSDVPSYDPPSYEERLRSADGSRFWAVEFGHAYDSGYLLAGGDREAILVESSDP